MVNPITSRGNFHDVEIMREQGLIIKKMETRIATLEAALKKIGFRGHTCDEDSWSQNACCANELWKIAQEALINHKCLADSPDLKRDGGGR